MAKSRHKRPNSQNSEGPKDRREQLMFGAVLIAVGTVMALSRAGLVEDFNPRTWWPLLLIAWGIMRCLGGRLVPGVAMAALGAVIQVDRLGYAEFRDTWPLTLIVVGVAMAVESRERGSRARHGADTIMGDAGPTWAAAPTDDEEEARG